MKNFSKNVATVSGTILSIFILIIFIYGAVNYGSLEQDIQYSLEQYGSPLIIFLSFLLEITFQVTSAHLVLLSALVIGYDPFLAISFVIIGATLAAIIGFYLGTILEKKLVQKAFDEKTVEKVKRQMQTKGRWYATVAAISFFPYLPILFSTFGMSWKNFIIHGIIPRIIGLVTMGLFIINFFI